MKEYWKDRFSRAKNFVVLGDSQRQDEERIRRLIIDWEEMEKRPYTLEEDEEG